MVLLVDKCRPLVYPKLHAVSPGMLSWGPSVRTSPLATPTNPNQEPSDLCAQHVARARHDYHHEQRDECDDFLIAER